MIRAVRENLSHSKMKMNGEFHVATKMKYYYMKSSCTAFTHKDVNGHAIPCAL
jgi:hypothetical protein